MATLWCSALRACLAAFAELGLDAAAIRDAAGIDEEVVRDPDARIPMAQTARIWPAAQAQWRRPGLGLHAGAAVPAGALGVLELVYASAETVRDGLAGVARSFRFVSGGETSFELESDREMTFGGVIPEQVRDYAIAGMVGVTRRYGPGPIRVTLAGPPFDEPATYRELLACDVIFDGDDNRIEFAATELEARLPARYRSLRGMVEREVDWLTGTADLDLLGDVRCSIALLLPRGAPTLTAVSRRLGVGERTLQRRLKERGTSLRLLIDDVRHELALRHLDSDRLSIGEIAYLLGYADPPAFAHAFKRWTGLSPSEARRQDRGSR